MLNIWLLEKYAVFLIALNFLSSCFLVHRCLLDIFTRSSKWDNSEKMAWNVNRTAILRRWINDLVFLFWVVRMEKIEEIHTLIINSFDFYISVRFIWLEKRMPAWLLHRQAIRSTKDVMTSLICFTAWVVHVGHAQRYNSTDPVVCRNQISPEIPT